MSPGEFFDLYKPYAARVGESLSYRMRFRGWDRDDMRQFAWLVLWKLALKGRAAEATNPEGYIKAAISWAVSKKSKTSRELYAAADKSLQALTSRPELDLTDAPDGVIDLLHGNRVNRRSYEEAKSWAVG